MGRQKHIQNHSTQSKITFKAILVTSHLENQTGMHSNVILIMLFILLSTSTQPKVLFQKWEISANIEHCLRLCVGCLKVSKWWATQFEGCCIIVTKVFHWIFKFVIWVSEFFMSYIVRLQNGENGKIFLYAPKFYGLFN